MINISRLYCGQPTGGDGLRYGSAAERRDLAKGGQDAAGAGQEAASSAGRRRPVVVWNITRACNLRCIHCYSNSDSTQADDELSTQQVKLVLDDLAKFSVPVVLFSGGEPLMRRDLFELAGYAGELGLRTVFSTNGTLITANVAKKIKQNGISYVGVSLDGIGKANDRFRGVAGAFEKAAAGIRHCQDAEVRVGIRFTLTMQNVGELEKVFEFLQAQDIERACFYHLVPTGRGGDSDVSGLTHKQTKTAVDTILARTKAFKDCGRKMDFLTVDNHVDGVYVYLRLCQEDAERAKQVWQLLVWNGGGLYSSGVGIGCIDFRGKVHPDQFWRHYDLGDVRQRRFSEIWTDENEPLLKGLRNRRMFIKGRCRLCKFFDACGGSLRVRADLYFGDPWAPEPACYLSDDQIGLDEQKRTELERAGEIFQMPE